MAWRRPGDKPLSEPMIVILPTHICFTRPKWVHLCVPRSQSWSTNVLHSFSLHWRQTSFLISQIIYYSDVTMSAMASRITSLMIVYSTVYSGADQRKHQSSASLFPHKGPVTWKMFPFDDDIMVRETDIRIQFIVPLWEKSATTQRDNILEKFSLSWRGQIMQHQQRYLLTWFTIRFLAWWCQNKAFLYARHITVTS